LNEEPGFILDSYALLAFFNDENGGRRVAEVLRAAEQGTYSVMLSLVNLGEVMYITERQRGLQQAHEVLAAIMQLPIVLLEVDQEAVLAAAHVKAHYRVSYADAFVVAMAQKKDARILTGDPEFESLAPIIKLEWL
jgi:predicted nucleic acid-binding protein